MIDLTAIPMPASGKTPYSHMAYNTTTNCGFMELYAYQEWAALQYSILTGSNSSISKFPRRLVIMPNNNCKFYGSGSQGCMGPYCYVWIRGDRLVHRPHIIYRFLLDHFILILIVLFYFRANFPSTIFHELGHTQNLQHSSNCVWAYGDCSCSMGCASDRT